MTGLIGPMSREEHDFSEWMCQRMHLDPIWCRARISDRYAYFEAPYDIPFYEQFRALHEYWYSPLWEEVDPQFVHGDDWTALVA